MLFVKTKNGKCTEDVVYEYICEHPGLCTYELSKRLKMTGGNLRSALLRLKHKGLIKFKFERGNPRIKKLSYPVNAYSLLPKSLKKS